MHDDARDAEAEIAAIFMRLRARFAAGRLRPTPVAWAAVDVPLPARAQAEHTWAVTAERPFEHPPTPAWACARIAHCPVKRVLRKLMRWYVEPVAAHQRTFNIAMLASSTSSSNGQGRYRASRASSRSTKSRLSWRAEADHENRCLRAAGSVRARRHWIVVETLVDQLRERDHEVELVRSFKWYPGPRPLREALVWRLLDLEEVQGQSIVLLATKFPSCNPALEQGRLARPPVSAGLRPRPNRARAVWRGSVRPRDGARHVVDQKTLGEARRRFAISRNVADRLQQSTGLEAEVLVPPPQQLEYRSSDDVGNFILSVGRLDRSKRVDLLLEAAALNETCRWSWPVTAQIASDSSS